MLKILTHSFLLQNSPFLGAEVIVFFLGIHRLPDRNPCHYLSFHAKKITRTNCPNAHNLLIIGTLQASRQTNRTNSICPCYFFSGRISHFCLLPINKSAVFYLLAINKSNISSIIKALIALYDALGGDKGTDVLRVVGNLLCQCRLARCQGWLQERIAIARQYYLGGRRWNCI